MIRKALTVFALLISASSPAVAQTAGQEALDVLVLVDLSDRISQKLHPGQAARDSAALAVIADEFAKAVRRHRFLYSRDRVRVMYLDGTGNEGEPTIDIADSNRSRVVVVRQLPTMVSHFQASATAPLRTPKAYRGADFWVWFKDIAPTHLESPIGSSKTKRILVILTDGYINFSPAVGARPAGTVMRMDQLRREPDWRASFPRYALASVGRSFPGTTAVLLELAPIDPMRNVYETEMLRQYWRTWLAGMQIAMPAALTNQESVGTVRETIAQVFGN